MGAIQTINALKNAGEDFEYYPTTREIIEALYEDILKRGNNYFSLLDIGAGDCKVFKTIKEIADEKELLPEWEYAEIEDKEFYENSKLISIDEVKNYGNRYEITFINPDGKEDGSNIDLDQLIVLLRNTDIKDVDLSAIPEGEDAEYSSMTKENILNSIEKYERKKRYKAIAEREKNKLFIEQLYVMEKSQILIEKMPPEAIVVGTDFHENTLIDKQADVVFCNPPYSEYVKWTSQIIKEANASVMYFVIPRRWGKNRDILEALKARNATASLVGSFDFLNSEDRKARAYVSLIRVEAKKVSAYYRGKKYKEKGELKDPFKLWFDETFKIEAEQKEYSKWENDRKDTENKEKKIHSALINAKDEVQILVDFYNKDLQKLVGNYQKLGELDADLLKVLNVDLENLLRAFKQKIVGLKNLYWQQVFDKFEKITSRLTSKSRKSLLETLVSNKNIDFTYGNIQSVVIWVIKNANKYFDRQMIDVYDTFTTEDGLKLYKSNKHFNDDTWRYTKSEGADKYALDYRIVLHGYRSDDWSDKDRASDAQKQYLEDIIVIAKNLGYNVDSYGYLDLGSKKNIYFSRKNLYKKDTKTHQGKIDEVYCHTATPNETGEEVMEKDGIIYIYDSKNERDWYQYKIGDRYYGSHNVATDKDIFTTVKCFKNGNVHFQFNKKFIQRLNLEVGRLRGWVKSPKEAAEEFDISIEEAQEGWNSNFTFLPESLSNLLPSFKKEDDAKEVKPEAEEEIPEIINNVSYAEEDLGAFKNGTLF